MEKEKYEMECEMWVARDMNDDLYAFANRPRFDDSDMSWKSGAYYDSVIELENDMFPNLYYDDEPIKVSISIKIEKK